MERNLGKRASGKQLMTEKRFSPSCENNRLPIVEQLRKYLADRRHVLEIGSGTGQHAVYFAPELPHLHWQTSDMLENHPSIHAWLADSEIENISVPIAFQLGLDDWPQEDALEKSYSREKDTFPKSFDAVYSANTAHIMQKHEVKLMIELIAKHLPEDGVFCQYGPFIEAGKFSSESNESFHHRLIAEGYGGYRAIEELQDWVSETPLKLHDVIDMPANNLMLIWKK